MNSELLIPSLLILLLVLTASSQLEKLKLWQKSNLSLPLALLTSNGVLLATGTIELAGRYGQGALIALVAFTLIFIFSPILLSPLRRLNRVTRFATVSDFLAFRYRGRRVASLSSAAMMLVCLPLLIAQFIALQSLATFIRDDVAHWILLGALALMIFHNWQIIRRNSTIGLRALLGFAGLLLLAALALSTLVSVDAVFGNFGAMNQWAVDSGQTVIIQRLESGYMLLAVFLAASFALPVNFNFTVSQGLSKQQIAVSSWGYPLLMLLIALPIFPLLWSGLAATANMPLQQYVYALPMLAGNSWASALAAIAVLWVALACVCSLSINLARIATNGLVFPRLNLSDTTPTRKLLEQRLTLVSLGLVAVAFSLSLLVSNHSVLDYYVVGFSGLAQFAPGILAATYAEKFNRRAFLGGLAGGLGIWFVALFLPLLIGTWQWQLPFGITLVFGSQNWGLWTLEASLLNIAIGVMFSRYGKMSHEEKIYAELCMLDNAYIPARIQLQQSSLADICHNVEQHMGQEGKEMLDQVIEELEVSSDESRPAQLRKVRDSLFGALAMRFGYLTGHKLLEKMLPLADREGDSSDDLNLIESVLTVHSDRLSGITRELNRLRIYHSELLNSLPIGVLSISSSGEILIWNRAMASYSGIEAQQAIGSHLDNLPSPWRELIQTIVDSDMAQLDDYPCTIDNKSCWFSLHKAIASSGDSDELLVVVEDCTESVTLTQRHIDHNRLASIGRLAAGVAHEIGNPVTGIACLAQDLSYTDNEKELQQQAAQILTQTERISRIVQSLVNFSRGERPVEIAEEAVCVASAASEAIELLSLSPSKEITFHCTIDQKISICGDHHQLVQVFVNLLSNARDASPEHSTISVTAHNADAGVSIEVSDQGCGVSPDIQERIYEPFFTAKDPGVGTGLGLWIVYNLVKNLRGKIEVVSPATGSDTGTTVRLVFPGT